MAVDYEINTDRFAFPKNRLLVTWEDCRDYTLTLDEMQKQILGSIAETQLEERRAIYAQVDTRYYNFAKYWVEQPLELLEVISSTLDEEEELTERDLPCGFFELFKDIEEENETTWKMGPQVTEAVREARKISPTRRIRRARDYFLSAQNLTRMIETENITDPERLKELNKDIEASMQAAKTYYEVYRNSQSVDSV